jgi:protein gp37
MGQNSGIEWCDHTFNPWWQCTRVSPACDNCYAATLANRWGYAWGQDAPRRFFGEKHWAEPLKWNREAQAAGVRRRVFCGSMCDWAESLPLQHAQRGEMDGERRRLFDLIEATPNLDWLMLTKRPGNIIRMVPAHWLVNPPAHVWQGTTAENQEWADRRIPLLIQTPAAVRFLSCEPLLGPIEFSDVTRRADAVRVLGQRALSGIHWVIAGGESGPGARPMHPDWARSLRDQCFVADVPFFFKQWGDWLPMFDQPWEKRPKGNVRIVNHAGGHGFHGEGAMWTEHVGKKRAGRTLDGQEWSQFPEVSRAL